MASRGTLWPPWPFAFPLERHHEKDGLAELDARWSSGRWRMRISRRHESGAASAGNSPVRPAKNGGAAVQKYTSPKEYSGRSVDPFDAVHYRVAGRGLRILPC